MAMPARALDVEHGSGRGAARTEEQGLGFGFVDGTTGIGHEDARLDVPNADVLDIFLEQALGLHRESRSLGLDSGVIVEPLARA